MDTNNKNYYVVVFGNPNGFNNKFICECLLVESNYADSLSAIRKLLAEVLKKNIKYPNMGTVLEFISNSYFGEPLVHSVAGENRSIDYIRANIEKNFGANVFRVYDYRHIEQPRIRQY